MPRISCRSFPLAASNFPDALGKNIEDDRIFPAALAESPPRY